MQRVPRDVSTMPIMIAAIVANLILGVVASRAKTVTRPRLFKLMTFGITVLVLTIVGLFYSGMPMVIQ